MTINRLNAIFKMAEGEVPPRPDMTLIEYDLDLGTGEMHITPHGDGSVDEGGVKLCNKAKALFMKFLEAEEIATLGPTDDLDSVDAEITGGKPKGPKGPPAVTVQVPQQQVTIKGQ